MLGWSIMARAWRSASNRATTCFVSMPGLMIFSATLRRTGCGLLGHVDDAHAALADLLQQLVGADDRARALQRLRRFDRERWRGCGRLEEAVGILIDLEQALDALEQGGIRAAGRAEILPSLVGVFLLQGRYEEIAFDHRSNPLRQLHPPYSAPSRVGSRKKILQDSGSYPRSSSDDGRPSPRISLSR